MRKSGIGLLALLLSLMSGKWSTAVPQQSSAVWDPPAINRFPDHNTAARAPHLVPHIIRDGQTFFSAKFNLRDGAGRPASTGDSKPTPRPQRNGDLYNRVAGPDANSCAGCHNQPRTGGSGEFAVNVFVGAHFKDPPAVSITSSVTNERNTTGLFGAGAIEMIAREMTRELHAQRDAARAQATRTAKDIKRVLTAKGVNFGTLIVRADGSYDQTLLDGVDADLIVKPFGVKGVAISLREFSIAALNQHHGIQAVERYGWERTGRHDFDEDGVPIEFTIGQLSALTLFQASLPALPRSAPKTIADAQEWKRGEELFHTIGCASCHIPFLTLHTATFSEPNPYNRPGTVKLADVSAAITMRLPITVPGHGGIQKNRDGTYAVWAYSDLKRHRICDAAEPFFCNEQLRQDNVPTDLFLTAKLWDLATSAPYGHRGDCSTVSEAILHHGGEATPTTLSFKNLTDTEKRQLIIFLLSLGAQQ